MGRLVSTADEIIDQMLEEGHAGVKFRAFYMAASDLRNAIASRGLNMQVVKRGHMIYVVNLDKLAERKVDRPWDES